MNPPLPLRVVRRAAQQITQAAEWWEVHRTAAPDAIREELEKAFRLITAQPRIGARARNVELQGVRRVHLSRIHYDLYYHVLEDPPLVEVLAFWHARRGRPPVL